MNNERQLLRPFRIGLLLFAFVVALYQVVLVWALQEPSWLLFLAPLPFLFAGIIVYYVALWRMCIVGMMPVLHQPEGQTRPLA
jgi:hypothetical protein